MSNGYSFGKLIKFCLFLSALIVQVSFAQGSGTLKGKVYDGLTNDGLPGANVIVKGTSLGVAADLDGNYTLYNVPAGNQILKVTYLGYLPIEVQVTIPKGGTLNKDFGLSDTTIVGDEVVITAQAQGQLQAINQQLSSDKIANIVSEARIQQLPDFNAASALSRLPGVSTTQSSGEDNKVVIRGLSPKYNSIEVDGVKLSATGSSSIGIVSDTYVGTGGVQNDRSVDLTMVSPYMIRTIAVYKSLTPDMNANSIGGTVNMELREAPAGLHTDLLWQSGYTAKSNTYGNYRTVVSASDRFFNNKLGIYALVNAESYDRDADNMTATYAIAGEEVEIDPITGYRPIKVTQMQFERHLETRDRFGGNLILDYSLPNGSIKFVNLLARINSDYTNHNQYINYNTNALSWRLQIGENTTVQRMHSMKLDYDLGFVNADLSVSYTTAENKLDDSPVFNFNQVDGVKVSDRDNTKPEDLNYLVNFQGNDKVILRSGNLFSNDYSEEKFTYKADFEFPFNIGNKASGFIKFGGQFDDQSNNTDQEAPYAGFDGSANESSADNIANRMMKAVRNRFGVTISQSGELTGATFLNPDNKIFDPFLDNKYGSVLYSSNTARMREIMQFISSNAAFNASDPSLSNGTQGGWYNGPYQQFTNDYKFNQDYYAAYGMAKINFLDFLIIGGARYEKVKSDYFAYNAIDQRNMLTQKVYDTTSISENDYFLPMGQIKYSPFEWMDVRYAFTKTLSRPDYQQLTPKFTISQGGGINAGNPNLKPAQAYNHDLSFSFHNNAIGLFTVGGFYKTIEGFVTSVSYRLDVAKKAGLDSLERYVIVRDGVKVINPTNDKANITRPINNPFDAIVKGFELDFQHNFWYLPSPFSEMVMGINYARIYSESEYPYYSVYVIPGSRPVQYKLVDSTFKGRLIDQPNHVLNAYIGIDYKDFSTRLSFLFQDNSARSNGGEYPENDTYTKEYFRIDFSARQKLPWFNSEVFLDLNNLNDRTNSAIQKSIEGYQNIQNYGLTANIGLRIRY